MVMGSSRNWILSGWEFAFHCRALLQLGATAMFSSRDIFGRSTLGFRITKPMMSIETPGLSVLSNLPQGAAKTVTSLSKCLEHVSDFCTLETFFVIPGQDLTVVFVFAQLCEASLKLILYKSGDHDMLGMYLHFRDDCTLSVHLNALANTGEGLLQDVDNATVKAAHAALSSALRETLPRACLGLCTPNLFLTHMFVRS